jgi:hypothetical protein
MKEAMQAGPADSPNGAPVRGGQVRFRGFSSVPCKIG